MEELVNFRPAVLLETWFMFAGVLTQLALSLLLGLLAEAPPASAAGESDDERVLARAGLKTDSESLLTFFRRRTLTATDKRKLAALVRRLGDDSYDVRIQASADLVTVGVVAVPF